MIPGKTSLATGKLNPKPEDRPTSPEKSRPAAGKPSRAPETQEKPKVTEKKPRRGDQSPDSIDDYDADDDNNKPKQSLPIDVLKKIPLKEQCICELCTCG